MSGIHDADILKEALDKYRPLNEEKMEFIQVGSGPTAVHLQVPAEMERLIAWYQEHRGELHRGGCTRSSWPLAFIIGWWQSTPSPMVTGASPACSPT